MSTATFDVVGDQFIAYYDQVRGYIRQEVIQTNLTKHISASSLKVLDVGGGDGREALWLSKQGHEVTLIDPSEKMITKAKQRFSNISQTSKVTILQSDPEEHLKGVVDSYDVVLSHGVVMYLLKNVDKHLALLQRVVKPSGVVSIVTKGMAGAVERLVSRGDTKKAMQLAKTGYTKNNLNQKVLSVTPEGFSAALEKAGLSCTAWYGVRVSTERDFRRYDSIPKEQLRFLFRTEINLSVDKHAKGMGQMLHFIAKKL